MASEHEDHEQQPQDQHGESIDLGFLMGVLSRSQLEMVLVKFILEHPESDHILLDACSNLKVTEAELAQELPFDDETTPLEVITNAEENVLRASKFVLAKDHANALVILNFCTRALVDALGPRLEEAKLRQQSKKQKKHVRDEQEEREELEETEGFVQRLETVWEQALSLLAERLRDDPEQLVIRLKRWFETLAAWRLVLQALLGPVFSDPLRVIKRALKQAESKPEFAAAAAAAATSSSSNKFTGQKRKEAEEKEQDRPARSSKKVRK